MTNDTNKMNQKTFFLPDIAWDNVKGFLNADKPQLPIFPSQSAWALQKDKTLTNWWLAQKLTRNYEDDEGSSVPPGFWEGIWQDEVAKLEEAFDLELETSISEDFNLKNWLFLMEWTNLSSEQLAMLLVREELLDFAEAEGHTNGWDWELGQGMWED